MVTARRYGRIGASVAATLLLASSQLLAQDAKAAVVKFNIEPQPLAQALNTWADQAGLQVIWPVGDAAASQSSPAVRGRLEPMAALQVLLENTGLTYSVISGGQTVAIHGRGEERGLRTGAPGAPPTSRVAEANEEALASAPANASSAAGKAASSSPKAVDRAAANVDTLAEVIVTGTYIRGAATHSQVIAFTPRQIAETGYTTFQDWIETLPQNFGGGPNEEGAGTGNFNRGTGINLRGLGTGATLVLVNGRRQPASGLDGDFVDISSLPSSAVERVEVLTDGASALYGSDAIGGVVNFVLRKDFNGAETSVRYGSAKGGIDETFVSQLFGVTWGGGHAMLDYQYYDRPELEYADRKFTASADKRPFGGTDFRSLNSNPGNIISTFPPTGIPSGQDGTDLEPSDLLPGVVTLQEPQLGASVLPERTMHSAFFSASQDVGENLELFLEGRFSKRDGTYNLPAFNLILPVTLANPFFVSPNGAPFILLGYSFYDDFGTDLGVGRTKTLTGSAGATLGLPGDWSSTLSLSSGKEELDFSLESRNFAALFAALSNPNPATAFNPFGDGSHTNPATLASIESFQIEDGRSELQEANLIADGQFFETAAGSAKLAIGANYRTEDLARGTVRRFETDRSVAAGFAELVVPILRASDGADTVSKLELSAAGRFEDYSDFGSTFNPKLSLRFRPTEALGVRASWGTSFKAPKLIDLDDTSKPRNFAQFTSLPDPQSPTGIAFVLFRSGGRSTLKEETADTFTVGLDVDLASQLKASLTYYAIDYKDRIVTPGPVDGLNILFEEDQWSSVITRNPSRAEIDAVCNDPNFIEPVPDCLVAVPDAIVDLRQANLSQTKVSGLDLLVDQRIPTDFGDFGLQFNGTYFLNYKVATTAANPLLDTRNTIGNPVDLRLRATGSWDYRSFSLSLSLNHTDGYDDSTSVSPSIDAWNTVDFRAAYTTPASSGWLAGLELSVTAANVLDEDPPFANNILGYDPANATPLGRVVAIQLTKSW